MPFKRSVWLGPVCLSLVCLALAACSDDGNDAATSVTSDEPPQIVGRVINIRTGAPIQSVDIASEPATEQVSTDDEGRYTLRDANNAVGGEYTISASHIAYRDEEARVTVFAGDTRRADFQLVPNVNGLVADPRSVQLAANESRFTFRLSSTAPDTPFSILREDPWVRVTPSQGVIANGETRIIEVSILRSMLPVDVGSSSALEINANNGLAGTRVEFTVDPVGDPSNERQKDCRILEILRVGLGLHTAPLIQFLESPYLPVDEGPRFINLPNAALFDSFIVEEDGNVTITHVNGGLEVTSLEVMELALDDELNSMGSNIGGEDGEGRASVQVALVPGVYCYVLHGGSVAFEPSLLRIDFDHEPLQ